MEDQVNFEERPADPKKDRSLLYWGIGLGVVVLTMGYLTFFVDNVHSLFSNEPEIITITGTDSSKVMNENANMSDAEVRSSLIKFIESFYRDQRKGYFDPPSYFAPITETYFNFHNLTYVRLREVHRKRSEDMQQLNLHWIVSSLDFTREENNIVATYWASINYVKPLLNREESADVKYEMVVNPEGKIISLKEVEIKNLVSVPYESYADSLPGEETNYPEPSASSGPTSQPALARPAEEPSERLYDLGTVSTPPEFRGGTAALARFIGRNLRYPNIARENKVQGKVYISFIVEKDGSLSDFKTLRGIGSGCDEEAIRVLKMSQPWQPGQVNGKPVRTAYVQPITYQLSQ